MPRVIARAATVRCRGCGRTFSACVSEEDGWKAACSHCGHANTAVPPRSRKPAGWDVHAGNRSFYGEKSRSIMEGCHRKEIPLLKRIVGPDLESCVKSDGSVVFKDRATSIKFRKAMDDARLLNSVKPGCFLSQRAQAKLAAAPKSKGPDVTVRRAVAATPP